MGAYTSWAMFSLCHHLVVRACGYYVYQHFNFDKYFLLGDDIVIADRKVASTYQRVISKVLGVQINLSKSIVSADSLEFAKRLLVEGVDCSPIPWTQLLRVNNPLTVLATFLAD